VLAPTAISATAEQTFGLITTVEPGPTHFSHSYLSMHSRTTAVSEACATLRTSTLAFAVLPIKSNLQKGEVIAVFAALLRSSYLLAICYLQLDGFVP
jgi:hypothetical protein